MTADPSQPMQQPQRPRAPWGFAVGVLLAVAGLIVISRLATQKPELKVTVVETGRVGTKMEPE
jgi:hypothetical protein